MAGELKEKALLEAVLPEPVTLTTATAWEKELEGTEKITEILEISKVPKASNEPETLEPVLQKFNIGALLEDTEKSDQLEMTTSAFRVMVTNYILDQGFGRTKVCTVVTSM